MARLLRIGRFTTRRNGRPRLAFSSETWGYAHVTSLLSDTDVVCDWSGVSDAADSLSLPACARGTCAGHREGDLLPFDDLARADGAVAEGRYSNAEFYALIDPASGALPYVYDSLTYWPGCDSDTLV